MAVPARTLLPFLRVRATRGTHAQSEPSARSQRWPNALDAGLAVILGLAVLLVHDVPYLLHHSFWLDEGWVADTVRAPVGLTRSLAASTPLGWTYLLRLVPFGGPERLRLVPLAFAMLAAAAGYLLGRELRLSRYLTGVLTGTAVLLSPAMLVRDDLKQYTAEACAGVVMWLLVARVENDWRFRRLAAVAAVGSIGLLFASSLIFVGVAAMAALALECLVRRHYRRLAQVAVATAGMLVVSLAYYLTLIRPTETPKLVAYWRAFYMPITTWHAAGTFLQTELTGLAPYLGFKSLTIDSIAVLAGIVALVWMRRIALAALFPITLAIVIVASGLSKYPFGDVRTSTFWLVLPPVLMAIAVAALARLAGRLDRRVLPALVCAIALAIWVDATGPYIRSHLLADEDAHAQTVYVERHMRPGDVVLVNLKASYEFAYYYPAQPSFPLGISGPNGHVVAYPSLPWLVVMIDGGVPPVPRALAEARAKIAAEPPSHRGRIWIIRSHMRANEIQEWKLVLAGLPVKTINVGPEPLLLVSSPPGRAAAPGN